MTKTQKRRNKRRERIATAVMVVATLILFASFILGMVSMLFKNVETLQYILLAVSTVAIVVDVIAISKVSLK